MECHKAKAQGLFSIIIGTQNGFKLQVDRFQLNSRGIIPNSKSSSTVEQSPQKVARLSFTRCVQVEGKLPSVVEGWLDNSVISRIFQAV